MVHVDHRVVVVRCGAPGGADSCILILSTDGTRLWRLGAPRATPVFRCAGPVGGLQEEEGVTQSLAAARRELALLPTRN
eukprot:1950473-Prymnesium_polylepis.2